MPKFQPAPSASMQMRLEHESPLYNPSRDVAHNFQWVVREINRRLLSRRWPALDRLIDERQLTDEQLGTALDALITFVRTAVDEPTESMEDAPRRSGWFDVPDGTHVAIMAYLGTIIAGVYFRGVREATLGGNGPCSDVHELCADGGRACRLLTMSRWRRPFWLAGQRCRAAWRAFGRKG